MELVERLRAALRDHDLPAEVAQVIGDAVESLDVPEVHDFAKAVVLEAAHQRERWGVDHDAGKTDPDWFWLIGYLAGKALFNPGEYPEVGDTCAQLAREKRLHRIVTVAAAAANWHAAVDGSDTRMRPGIEPPDDEA